MVSPDNGITPYVNGNKANSGKFIIEKYAVETRKETVAFDLLVVDFMPIIFSQPPSHVYSAKCYLKKVINETPYLALYIT